MKAFTIGLSFVVGAFLLLGLTADSAAYAADDWGLEDLKKSLDEPASEPQRKTYRPETPARTAVPDIDPDAELVGLGAADSARFSRLEVRVGNMERELKSVKDSIRTIERQVANMKRSI